MEKCNCNELCFYYRKTSLIIKDGLKYCQINDINKCNRLLNDNFKKKPCDYNSIKLVHEKLLDELDISKTKESTKEIKEIKKKTHKDIYYKIQQMIKYYNIKCFNYFGNLNYNLNLIGYHTHDPTKESLNELKCRLSKYPKNKTYIYINYQSYFSKCVEEYDYNDEWEKEILTKIKNKEDPFNWTKDEFIKNLLSKNKKINKYKKYKKSIKCYNFKKDIDKQNEQEKIDNDIENNIENDNENDNDDKNNSDSDDHSDDSDDDDKSKNSDNLKDNEFDVDIYSDNDEDYDNNDYDDFSD